MSFKRIKPDFGDGRVIGQFPHCDMRVLHAPNECQYCDQHRDWQELRKAWGIAFTGWEPEENEVSCPSDKARGLAGAHVWGGNRPKPECK